MNERFLTPSRAGDVFVTIGSGAKTHIVAASHLEYPGIKVAVCGRRGRIFRRSSQHTTPPELEERHRVCEDCREFARATDG